MAELTAVQEVNANIVSSITSINWLNVLGWIFLLVVLAGGGFWYYSYAKNKKIFKKRITAFEMIGNYWEPASRDLARTVKLGSGGFEILYLKNAKTWKIAYGGRVGKNDYYFFVMPDGYWYNGMLAGGINRINETKGLVPIVTTNPLMRGQYTALEKQIDTLHGNKTNFWDKYGSAILSIAFVLIAGVVQWLVIKEFSNISTSVGELVDKVGGLVDTVNKLMTTVQSSAPSGGGLVPA